MPEWGFGGSCPGCCGSRRLLTFYGQPFNCGQEGKVARNKTVFKSKQEKVLCFACPPDVVTVQSRKRGIQLAWMRKLLLLPWIEGKSPLCRKEGGSSSCTLSPLLVRGGCLHMSCGGSLWGYTAIGSLLQRAGVKPPQVWVAEPFGSDFVGTDFQTTVGHPPCPGSQAWVGFWGVLMRR